VTKTTSPQPGDLFVRTTGTYGHVAVITAVHSSTVCVKTAAMCEAIPCGEACVTCDL